MTPPLPPSPSRPTPPTFPKREYTPYNGQSLPPYILKRRNPFAQSSVSALKAFFECRRLPFFQSILGLSTPQHPAAAAGEKMHAEAEAWYQHNTPPTHPSVKVAIEASLIPARSPNVSTEELFWIPTGVSSPRSPDGQLWLKGYMDIVERQPGWTEISDLKSKENIEGCERYGLTPEGLTLDEQMACYGHVVHSQAPGQHLTVGHVYLVRNPAIPYAKKVSVVLTPDAARRTYLKLLDVAEKLVGDSECGDFQAIPGNFGKCDKMFGRPCWFRPICHGSSEGTTIIDIGNVGSAVEAILVKNPPPPAFIPTPLPAPGMTDLMISPEAIAALDPVWDSVVQDGGLQVRGGTMDLGSAEKDGVVTSGTPARSVPAKLAIQMEIPVPSPLADQPILITPPDAAPPLAKMPDKEPKAPRKKKDEAVKFSSEPVTTSQPKESPVSVTETKVAATEIDFDSILNMAMGVTAAPVVAAPAVTAQTQPPPPPPPKVETPPAQVTPPPPPPPAPVNRATPVPAGQPGAGDTDADSLDALLGAAVTVTKGMPVPPAMVKTPLPPVVAAAVTNLQKASDSDLQSALAGLTPEERAVLQKKIDSGHTVFFTPREQAAIDSLVAHSGHTVGLSTLDRYIALIPEEKRVLDMRNAIPESKPITLTPSTPPAVAVTWQQGLLTSWAASLTPEEKKAVAAAAHKFVAVLLWGKT